MSIASRTFEQRGEGAAVARDDAWVVAALEQHSASMMALARRYSLCADDAQEAYQRTAEIFLRRAASVEPATVGGWLRTVIKHESWTVRTQRTALVSEGEGALEAAAPAVEDAAERVELLEHLGTAAEALERLKPQELRALVLLAEGHTYKEICAITGWTYTKVNRCVTEGRRAFRERVAAIEAGEECKRWAPALSALADGESPLRQLLVLRPHLRRCPACRATLRAYREAPAQVAALAAPVALGVPAAAGGSGLWARLHEALSSGLHDRVVISMQKAQSVAETASAGKLAAVAASTVAIAGGGYAAGVRLVSPAHPRVHVHRTTARVNGRRVSERTVAVAGATSSTGAHPLSGTPATPVETPAAQHARVASAEFTPEDDSGGGATNAGTGAQSSGGSASHAARRARAATAHSRAARSGPSTHTHSAPLTTGTPATGEFGP